VGPVDASPNAEDGRVETNTVYLRPETCQGIFVDFKNILDTTRNKLPFGIAQIGKSFRNEITPGNFIFRTLEFEQQEMEYFVKDAASAKQAFDDWRKTRLAWFKSLGIKADNLKLHDHAKTDLAHYAVEATDIEYNFPFGFSELEGIHNRGNYDLTQHEKFSGTDLRYFDEETNEKVLPHVVETSGGVDRATLAFLTEAYTVEKTDKEERTVLRFHPRLAPIKAAILPLVKKEPLLEISQKLYEELRKEFFVELDSSGTVGKRYRRQDEVGTPYCFTIDFDTVEDQTVTVRDRDSMEQERIPIASVADFLRKKLQ